MTNIYLLILVKSDPWLLIYAVRQQKNLDYSKFFFNDLDLSLSTAIKYLDINEYNFYINETISVDENYVLTDKDKQDVKEELNDIQDLDFSFKYKDFIGNSNMLEVENLKFGYNENEILIENLNFKITKGDKVCIIGKNGKGKSTLLKLLYKILQPLNGNIKLNTKTEVGYFGQMNIDTLNQNNTIYEELQDKEFEDEILLRNADGAVDTDLPYLSHKHGTHNEIHT